MANEQGYFTSQNVNQAIDQNIGLTGQSAAQSVFGMLPEKVIASDFLLAAKKGVTSYAKALTEASTPKLRTVLKKHLQSAIALHESIFNYMSQKGYYDAWNPEQLIQMDLQAADNALLLQNM